MGSPVREGPVDKQDGAVIDQGDGFCVLVDGSIVPASKQSSAKLLEGAGSAATGMDHACLLAALEQRVAFLFQLCRCFPLCLGRHEQFTTQGL